MRSIKALYVFFLSLLISLSAQSSEVPKSQQLDAKLTAKESKQYKKIAEELKQQDAENKAYQTFIRDISEDVYMYQQQATLNRLRDQALDQLARAMAHLPGIISYHHKYHPNTIQFKIQSFLSRIQSFFGTTKKNYKDHRMYEMQLMRVITAFQEAKIAASLYYNYTLGYLPVLTNSVIEVAESYAQNIEEQLKSYDTFNNIELDKQYLADLFSFDITTLRSNICPGEDMQKVQELYKNILLKASETGETPRYLPCFN